MAQIDITGKIKVYPYVRPEVSATEQQASADAADLESFISDLESGVSQIPDITQIFNMETAAQVEGVGDDQWKAADFIPTTGPVGEIVKGLDKAITKLDKLVTILYKILKIIGLFISGFSSFSKLLSSAITLAQKKLDDYLDSGLTAGVYANIIAPPALLKKSAGDIDSMSQLRGGFDGFTARLESSLSDPKDNNKPTFTMDDYVGGLVIMLDTESLDVLWSGLKQLASMFDFMKLFGLDLAPPPPKNLRGFCGSFKDESHETPVSTTVTFGYGVQIEWDQNYTAPGFMLYRSRIPGGTTKIVEYVPTTLFPNKETGEPGLITIARQGLGKIFKGKAELPEKEEIIYEDPDFTPVYIPAGMSPSLKYVDYLKTKKVNGIDVPYYVNDNGKEVSVPAYYYIIRSCDSGQKNLGPYSKELCVAIKVCNDSYKLADLIPHPNGRYELFSAGYGKINSWSTIQIGLMVPWIKDVVEYMNKFLDSLKGMVTGVSESFTKFLTEMKAKIDMYVNLLKLISWFIEGLKNFMLGSSIAFLKLDIKKGGMPVFMERVKRAQPPEGDTFSGPYGITVGVVLVVGGSNLPALKATIKTIEFIQDFFTD